MAELQSKFKLKFTLSFICYVPTDKQEQFTASPAGINPSGDSLSAELTERAKRPKAQDDEDAFKNVCAAFGLDADSLRTEKDFCSEARVKKDSEGLVTALRLSKKNYQVLRLLFKFSSIFI